MKVLQNGPLWRLALGVGVVALSCALLGGSGADERIGKVQQGLVGGDLVSEKTQEAYGLLKLSSGGSCSASLLRNNWAITAAHCVDAKDAAGNAIKDPNRPGQNKLIPLSSIKLTAAWGGKQTKRAVRVHTFWPYDVAVIKLNTAVKVNGSTTGYNRGIFLDQFPYFGTPTGATLTVFGRGINQFATGSGDSAVPSQSDGKFRMGKVQAGREEGTLYWYPTGGKLQIAGGDSGGPSFATVGVNKQSVLVGVHALTLADYVKGKPTEGWDWVTRTREAADTPIKPVWPEILKLMGSLKVSPPAEVGEHHAAVFENTVPFGTNPRDVDHILYGVKADGTLVWHRHIVSGTGATRKHLWNPTANVGTGWQGLTRAVLPAGGLGMYALQANGDLRWYWHTGALRGTFEWRDPQTVGTGWGELTSIIPMDHGVIYGLLPNGYLKWHKHLNYRDGKNGVNGWTNSKIVGWGWNDSKTIFSGGNGILYVVKKDGTLMWYHHKAYLNAVNIPSANSTNAEKLKWQNTWEEPKAIGTGWGGFTKLFSPGEGDIYGILPNGDLMWYRHTGWKTGAATWDPTGRVKIAGGWDSYSFPFARIETSDLGDPETDIVVK